MTRPEFILKYYGDALKATILSGLFPETLITQAILESLKPSGLSNLARLYKNYFGIKADTGWTGKVVSLTTAEFLKGKRVVFTGTNKVYANRQQAIRQGANFQTLFRVYDSTVAGFRGWVDFLKRNRRYSNVFKQSNPVLQFAELQKAGYATDPSYSNLLTSIYNRNKAFFGQAQAYFSSIAKTMAIGLPLFF